MPRARLGTAIAVGAASGLTVTATSAKFLLSKWGPVTPIRLSQPGYLGLGLLTPLYFLARSPTEVYLIAGMQMAAVNCGNSLLPTVVQSLAPAQLRGRVFAISTVIFTLFQVVSPIAAGAMSDHVFTQPGGLLMSSIVIGTPSCLLAAATPRPRAHLADCRRSESHVGGRLDHPDALHQTEPMEGSMPGKTTGSIA
jgi:hypothetical protein